MIIDARLGGGSGVSAVETISRVGPIAHLFISGARVEASEPGAIVLQKPFREIDLVRAMQRALDAPVAA